MTQIQEIEDNDELLEAQLLSAHVSLHSMFGWTNTRSIMLKDILHYKEIITLIDSGASHNFLCSILVDEFHLPCNLSVQFEVTLQNGQLDKGQGLCEAVPYLL